MNCKEFRDRAEAKSFAAQVNGYIETLVDEHLTPLHYVFYR